MKTEVLLGASAALAVAVLIASFTGTTSVASRVATSTMPNGLVALPEVPLNLFPLSPGQLALGNQPTTSSEEAATSSPKAVAASSAKTAAPVSTIAPKTTAAPVTAPVSQPTIPPPPPDPEVTQAGLDGAASNLRSALVNILCISNTNSLHSISGSGVIVDSKGIILTNAHIGQFFLLNNYPVPGGDSCTIRTGSPAEAAYTAKLIYISPFWIQANSSVLSEAQPVGNGQYDFAFLAITGSATGAALPSSFPSVTLATAPPAINDPIVIGSYAAQFLTTSEIESSLYQTVVFGSIKAVYTYAKNTIDVASFGGTVAAQEGSSGGGAIDGGGKLTATITTSTVEGDTSTRELRGITASYIEREYNAETGSTLSILFAEPLLASIASFALQAPALEAVITNGLSQ